MRIELEQLPDSTLSSLRADWEAVAAEATCSPFLTFGWLESWATVYCRRPLVALRCFTADDQLVGVGLLEEFPMRGLRFAGEPISPERGLLCRRGHDHAVWGSLIECIRDRGERWLWLEAAGVDLDHHRLPRAVLTPIPWLGMELPERFESYLESRPSELRRNLRRKLRLAAREGATLVDSTPESLAAGIGAFIALHRARASSKGERHQSIDARLEQFLLRLGRLDAPRLWMTQLQQDGHSIAVSAQLDHDGTCWFYNVGFDPGAARLSPGIVVRLSSIEHAIERGARHCDMGPGASRYKQDLGAQRHDRLRIEVSSRSAVGQLYRVGTLSRRRAREIEWLRAAVATGHRWLPG